MKKPASRRLATNAHERRNRPPETLIELLTRDLEAWRLAKGVITKASSPKTS